MCAGVSDLDLPPAEPEPCTIFSVTTLEAILVSAYLILGESGTTFYTEWSFCPCRGTLAFICWRSDCVLGLFRVLYMEFVLVSMLPISTAARYSDSCSVVWVEAGAWLCALGNIWLRLSFISTDTGFCPDDLSEPSTASSFISSVIVPSILLN